MYLVYGGVKYSKVRQAAYCKLCKETIESKDLHDYKLCSCGAIGIDYDRFIGTEWEDRRTFCAEVRGKKIWLPCLPSSLTPADYPVAASPPNPSPE
jgi:hypothetical protein